MGDVLYIKEDDFKQFLQNIETLPLRKLSPNACRLMFKVLLYGGMRISEVLQITPNDLVNDRIRLRITKGGKRTCKCAKWSYHPTRLLRVNKNCPKCKGKGKFRIDTWAWIIPELYQELLNFSKVRKPDERIFPLNRTTVWKYTDKLLQGRTHTFRHSFLTWMLNSGKMDVRDIMQKARHTNLAVTSRYIENNDDVTKEKEAQVFKLVKLDDEE